MDFVVEKLQCRHETQNPPSLEEKGPHAGQQPPSLESSYRTYLCHHLLGVGSRMEAELTGFWQTPDGSATLDGALFNEAQIIDSFSSDMEMQTWKTAARHSSGSGLEKGIITSFAKKARSQLIKEGNFMAARALDFLVCGAINEPHLLADGSIPNQFFLCPL